MSKEQVKLAVEGFFASLPVYWKLATLRCCLYAVMVGWGTFRAGVEGYDMISQLTSLQRVELAGDVLVAMIGVWLAFLDTSINKIGPPTNTTVETHEEEGNSDVKISTTVQPQQNETKT